MSDDRYLRQKERRENHKARMKQMNDLKRQGLSNAQIAFKMRTTEDHIFLIFGGDIKPVTGYCAPAIGPEQLFKQDQRTYERDQRNRVWR